MGMFITMNCNKCDAELGYVFISRGDIQSDDLDFICDKCAMRGDRRCI